MGGVTVGRDVSRKHFTGLTSSRVSPNKLSARRLAAASAYMCIWPYLNCARMLSSGNTRARPNYCQSMPWFMSPRIKLTAVDAVQSFDRMVGQHQLGTRIRVTTGATFVHLLSHLVPPSICYRLCTTRPRCSHMCVALVSPKNLVSILSRYVHWVAWNGF